jgi:2-keto-4-pentenoate hydratase
MAFDLPAEIESFWQAAQRGDHFPPDWYDKLDLDAAYRIQLGLIERRCANGERQIGWKVGLTAPAIQQQFGFHEPVFGCILQRDDSGRVFRPDELIKPGFEPELCLRIGHDLTGSVTPETARGAIDMVYPALEIIETRGPFTEQIALALADNAQQKTVVLGAGVALQPEIMLDRVEASVTINGATVAIGRGDAVLGNPVNSVVWLASKLGEYGRALKAGEIVMSGSFTRQFPIARGDRIRVDFAGIGAVEMSMSA